MRDETADYARTHIFGGDVELGTHAISEREAEAMRQACLFGHREGCEHDAGDAAGRGAFARSLFDGMTQEEIAALEYRAVAFGATPPGVARLAYDRGGIAEALSTATLRREIEVLQVPPAEGWEYPHPPQPKTEDFEARLRATILDSLRREIERETLTIMGGPLKVDLYTPTWWERHVKWPLLRLHSEAEYRLDLAREWWEDHFCGWPYGAILVQRNPSWYAANRAERSYLSTHDVRWHGGPIAWLWAQDVADYFGHADALRPYQRVIFNGWTLAVLEQSDTVKAYRVAPIRWAWFARLWLRWFP